MALSNNFEGVKERQIAKERGGERERERERGKERWKEREIEKEGDGKREEKKYQFLYYLNSLERIIQRNIILFNFRHFDH